MRPSPITPTLLTGVSTAKYCHGCGSSVGGVDLFAHDRVGFAHDRRAALRVTSPMMRTARPGPGNGCRCDDVLGQAEHAPSSRTSSLNSARSGSISASSIVSGKPPTLWCDLILCPALLPRRLRLDDVGIERALHQILHAGNLRRFFFEDAR